MLKLKLAYPHCGRLIYNLLQSHPQPSTGYPQLSTVVDGLWMDYPQLWMRCPQHSIQG
ncbi:MAG: hypothetical protein PHI42_05825 [Paludibacteraceae bacterium]|nr:hypothetical protein [Paludibacteraceae bacterium]